jgi:hypothetical protein
MSACGNKVEITNLTVEMQDGSTPLATATPRFSWNYEAKVDNVIQTIREIKKEDAKLITVVGCGGNRDKRDVFGVRCHAYPSLVVHEWSHRLRRHEARRRAEAERWQ